MGSQDTNCMMPFIQYTCSTCTKYIKFKGTAHIINILMVYDLMASQSWLHFSFNICMKNSGPGYARLYYGSDTQKYKRLCYNS